MVQRFCKDVWDVVGLRATSSDWNVPRKYGPHNELFFLLVKKEPFAFPNAMEFEPFVPAETLRACALIGLHQMAARGVSGSSSSCDAFAPELGEIPGLSGPRYPLWKDDVSCSGSESTLVCEVYEHNSECWAHRAGLVKRGGGALSRGLGAGATWQWTFSAKKRGMHVGIAQSRWALRVHCVRSVWKILSQRSARVESLESQLSQHAKAFLSPWTGCERKERSVVRELKERRNVSGRLKFRKKICK